eukprot:sb/3468867/
MATGEKGILKLCKQPIRTRYLGHVTGYQPIRDQYFLIRSVPGNNNRSIPPLVLLLNFILATGEKGILKLCKQPIRTRYLGHVTGYQPIRDQYFLIRLVPGCLVGPSGVFNDYRKGGFQLAGWLTSYIVVWPGNTITQGSSVYTVGPRCTGPRYTGHPDLPGKNLSLSIPVNREIYQIRTNFTMQWIVKPNEQLHIYMFAKGKLPLVRPEVEITLCSVQFNELNSYPCTNRGQIVQGPPQNLYGSN